MMYDADVFEKLVQLSIFVAALYCNYSDSLDPHPSPNSNFFINLLNKQQSGF